MLGTSSWHDQLSVSPFKNVPHSHAKHEFLQTLTRLDCGEHLARHTGIRFDVFAPTSSNSVIAKVWTHQTHKLSQHSTWLSTLQLLQYRPTWCATHLTLDRISLAKQSILSTRNDTGCRPVIVKFLQTFTRSVLHTSSKCPVTTVTWTAESLTMHSAVTAIQQLWFCQTPSSCFHHRLPETLVFIIISRELTSTQKDEKHTCNPYEIARDAQSTRVACN